jgi:glutathione S-transferase
MMKLYYSPGACSLSPHIVLLEAGAKFDLAKVEFPSKKTKDGEDLLAVNLSLLKTLNAGKTQGFLWLSEF